MVAKKFALGFGLAVILPMMAHYGVMTFYPPPKPNEYRFENYERYRSASAEERKALDRENRLLQEKRDEHEKQFQKRLFYVLVPVGLAAIVAGTFIGIQAVGSGLMFGGIFAITDGYFWYWSQLQNGLRFASLVVAFVLLLVIGFKRFSAPSEPAKRAAS